MKAFSTLESNKTVPGLWQRVLRVLHFSETGEIKMNIDHNLYVQQQFDLRAATFDRSVHWITDTNLVAAHVKACGDTSGYGLEMCCGTGAVSRAMKAAGWEMVGVDISPGMVEQARRYITAEIGDVANLSYPDHAFDAVILRQAYFLLNNGPLVLAEARRLLKPNGRLVISLTVPFSEIDAPWLEHVHTVKQAQMIRFFTADALERELRDNGFDVLTRTELTVRESVTKWMDNAPELSEITRKKVCNLVLNGPPEYRDLRQVKLENEEILEDWNWAIFAATPKAHQ